MTIDSHHHFWKYSAQEYGWIDDARSSIRCDFLPPDLEREIQAADVDGVVSVQARQTPEETDWLLAMADEYSFIRGVVGWLPLASAEVGVLIERYAAHPKMKGVRHVVEAEPDGFLDGVEFNRGIAEIKNQFVYDVLIEARQLEEAVRFVDRHPKQIFVLDHIAKPPIKSGVLQPWQSQITELARRENVFCKVSGMTTEAEYSGWTPKQLQPYFDVVLSAFGPQRLLFGSDWPVCLVATEYSRWAQTVREWTQSLSQTEQAAIMGENAQRVYDLESL
jgi:L-fuconolactonase